MKTIITAMVLSLLAAGIAWAAEEKVHFKKTPATTPANQFYPGNREPLLPSPLVKLPVGAVRPHGWLRKQLELMADGFTGHLDELSRFLQPDGNAWLDPKGEGKGSYWEELPYWLKGFGDLGYLLGEKWIVLEAQRWLEPAFASQREDGYFGPRRNLTNISTPKGGKPDLWPNMVMLNALQSYHEYTGDPRVPKLMARYFRYEMGVPEADFLLPYWQHQRAADNLQSVYWLYNRTGEPWLLELGEKIHRHTANWTAGVANWHGVNVSQSFRGPAVYYQQSKDPKYLAATERDYQTVRGIYGQVPGGLWGADENARPGYTDPRQAAETCTMAEMMLSDEMLVGITGDVAWADRCEDVAFNSLPASMTADLKALRYLTSPNLVLSDRTNKAPGVQNGGAMFLYDPRSHRCCQHNVSHGWPYFTEHLWMATAGNGLAAVLYAPCEVKAKVGDGTEVKITEETTYPFCDPAPFSDTIKLRLSMPKAVRFPLYLRVPGWSDYPFVSINGRKLVDWFDRPRTMEGLPFSLTSGYLVIERTWKDGDKVGLRLPMNITLTRWTKNKNSVSVNRGPLTFSLKIGEKIVRVGGTDKWPAVEIHPTTPWNYGLIVDETRPWESFGDPGEHWKSDQPFQWDAAPVELHVKAKKIPNWKQDQRGLVGTLCESPVKSDEPAETVTLIPMGCARLRIASFPTVGSGPAAHDWVATASADRHTASHCNENDTLDALSDGLVPKRSSDQSIPRFTWWPHRGTSEWVTYGFPQPRKVSEVEVYWFDDTGRGECRLPKSWRLEWLDGRQWRPVEAAGAYAAAADKFNRVSFAAVTTRQVRLVVELRPEFSAGILEWRLK